jgi:tetratricopeptide (TPR) repeat protein
MKKIILILIIFAYTGIINAQEIINYPTIDAKTYEQYEKKQWTELIETGKLSLKNNIDFYYLHVRMGIAYYELGKYSQAVKYFEKAHKENLRDDVINEYLYYSYLFAGYYDDIRKIIPFFSDKLIKKLDIKSKPFIHAIYFDTKQEINEDFVIEPDGSDAIEQVAVLRQSYYNLSLEHVFGKSVKVFHGFTSMVIHNNIQDLPQENIPTLYEETLKQREYYLQVSSLIGKQLNLKTSFHVISSTFFAEDSTYTMVGRRRVSNSYYYYYTERTYVGDISLSKTYPFFRPSIGVSVSNLNNLFQLQPQASLSISPFGNEKLRINSTLIYHNQFENGNLSLNAIVKESVSVNFLKHFYFEPSVTFGRLYNFTEYNSLVANNDLDPIIRRYDALLNISLAKEKFNIFFKYTYNIKENEYKIYGISNTQNYINQSITGGIKWYF